MKRGEVWWAALPSPVGPAPGCKRPVRSRPTLSTPAESGLPHVSVVNVSQLITLDRSTLSSRVKALTGVAMDQVDRGLALVLAVE